MTSGNVIAPGHRTQLNSWSLTSRSMPGWHVVCRILVSFSSDRDTSDGSGKRVAMGMRMGHWLWLNTWMYKGVGGGGVVHYPSRVFFLILRRGFCLSTSVVVCLSWTWCKSVHGYNLASYVFNTSLSFLLKILQLSTLSIKNLHTN